FQCRGLVQLEMHTVRQLAVAQHQQSTRPEHTGDAMDHRVKGIQAVDSEPDHAVCNHHIETCRLVVFPELGGGTHSVQSLARVACIARVEVYGVKLEIQQARVMPVVFIQADEQQLV